MAVIDSILNTSTPAASDDPREGDDRIRETKAALRDRLGNAGLYLEDSASADTSAGMITPGNQTRLSGGTLPAVTPGANDLIFFEKDRILPMVTWNDSSNLMKLGTGRGSGANTYTLETEVGNFETLDVAGKITLATKSIVGVYQAQSSTALNLTTSYVAVAESITFTTATAAGDVLLTWTGTYHYNGTANTDDASVSVEFRRGGSQIFEVENIVRLINADAGGEHVTPFTVQYLDTGASNATSTVYDIRVKHVISGSPTISAIFGNARVFIAQEFIYN